MICIEDHAKSATSICSSKTTKTNFKCEKTKKKKKTDNRIIKYDNRTITPTCVEGNHGIFFYTRIHVCRKG